MDRLKQSLSFWSIPFGLLLAWYLREVLLIIVAAIIFGSAVQVWALWLKQKTRLPFLASIFCIYITIISILILTLYGLYPVLQKEISLILPALNSFLGELNINRDVFYNQILSSTSEVFSNAGPILFNILGGVFSAGLILILSFYFSLDLNLYKRAVAVLPTTQKERMMRIWINARRKFAFWLSGQICLMITVGLATYLLMFIFKVPNAALIGTIAGLMEIIPVLGPILAAGMAMLLVLAHEPDILWWIVGGFIIIQQAENHFLVPLIMNRALAINPVFTLIAIMIGGAIGNILGVLTILPLVVLGIEIYLDYTGSRSTAQEESPPITF